jgi:ribonuclease III
LNARRERQLRGLEQRVGHVFGDLALLDRALTHASLVNESLDPDAADNEALEFLGDAVLGMVVADLMHRRDPDGAEGEKSRLRARAVSAVNLARHASGLGLPELLALGRGEEKTGGREKTALWADAFEAVVAALYLDGGFEAARRFVSEQFARDLEDGGEPFEDSKSALQERLQGAGKPLPTYTVVAEDGPSHRRRFRVECRLDDGTVTAGEDFSKKAAQQKAARLAIESLERRPASARR